MDNDATANNLNTMKVSIAQFIKPNPFIYWIDFLVTILFSWLFFCLAYILQEGGDAYGSQYLLVFASSIFFYRAIAFTHELVHLRKGAVPGFFIAWHILCGIPLLAPNFLYRAIHVAHHSKKNYGKESDGEYIGFGIRSRWLIIGHFFYNLLIPILSIFRFMIIAPLSLVNKKFRAFVMSKMSFMGLKFSFSRAIPEKKGERLEWYLIEFSCCLFIWLIFGLVALGAFSSAVMFYWYLVMICILTMNSLRSLGATHWYRSSGDTLSFDDQIKDSISITNKSLFTKILCPVETQYHALHHMFPSIPYHSLGNAYEHLLKNFPNAEILRRTSRDSLITSWKEILSQSRS